MKVLKKLRRDLGLSKTKLARDLGLTVGAIHQFENGLCNMSIHTAFKLIEYAKKHNINITLEDIFISNKEPRQ